MDPLSIALVSFTALKKGIALGKDISAMGKDLNKVFDFIDGTKAAQKSGNKNDPLSDYIAYEKALDMEKQLEQVIWETRGSKRLSLSPSQLIFYTIALLLLAYLDSITPPPPTWMIVK